jgi:hypothetical protein
MSDEVTEDVGVDSAPVADAPEQATTEESQSVASAPQQQEVWGAFRQLPQFQGQDDRAIAQRLYEAMQREQAASRALQQYQSAIPVVQDYIQNRPAYEEWRRAQQSQQAQPQPEKPKQPDWWSPPQVKDSYKRYLTRDENGREVISADAPLDARAALEDYQQYRADFAQKFLDNPEAALGPMVEKVAVDRAEQIVDARLNRMRDENYVSGLEQQNRDWLYDQNGNVSAEGAAVQKYIQDAKTNGISGAQARWDYATKMVERDLLLAVVRQSQQQPRQPVPQQQVPQQVQQPTAEQSNMDFLRQQAMRTASQRSAATTTARTPRQPMTFEERLLSAAQDEGLL